MIFGNLCIFQRPFGIAGKRDQKNNCILGCFCEIFEIGIVKFVNHLGISKKLIQQSSHPESGTVGRACTNNEAFFGIAQMGNNLIHIFLIQMRCPAFHGMEFFCNDVLIEIPIVQCVICCSCGNGKNVILYSTLHLGKTFKSQRISEAYDSGFAYGNFLAEFRKGGITE